MRLLALFALLALPPFAAAQNLPGWASPSEPADGGGEATASAPMSNAGPILPPPPTPVPVDGGLSLLALAGAGYAAHRLRRRTN